MQDNKSVCAVVMICTTLFDVKFELEKYGSNRDESIIICTCQMYLQCKFGDGTSVTCRDIAHMCFFYDDPKTKYSRSGDLLYYCIMYVCMYKNLCSRGSLQPRLSRKRYDQL